MSKNGILLAAATVWMSSVAARADYTVGPWQQVWQAGANIYSADVHTAVGGTYVVGLFGGWMNAGQTIDKIYSKWSPDGYSSWSAPFTEYQAPDMAAEGHPGTIALANDPSTIEMWNSQAQRWMCIMAYTWGHGCIAGHAGGDCQHAHYNKIQVVTKWDSCLGGNWGGVTNLIDPHYPSTAKSAWTPALFKINDASYWVYYAETTDDHVGGTTTAIRWYRQQVNGVSSLSGARQAITLNGAPLSGLNAVVTKKPNGEWRLFWNNTAANNPAGHNKQAIYRATSSNGVDFIAANGGQPALQSTPQSCSDSLFMVTTPGVRYRNDAEYELYFGTSMESAPLCPGNSDQYVIHEWIMHE